MTKKNGTQYFFAKKIDVSFHTAIFFAKNPLGLDIVGPFFFYHTFTFFFFYFFLTGLSDGEMRLLLIIYSSPYKGENLKRLQSDGKTAVWRCPSTGSGTVMLINRKTRDIVIGILLCAVPIVNKMPLHFSAEKKHFIDYRYMEKRWTEDSIREVKWLSIDKILSKNADFQSVGKRWKRQLYDGALRQAQGPG